MKILMLGLFTGNVFDGDEILAYGFEQLGHHVTKFNYRKTPFMNFKLLTLWKQYDLLIIGKGESISPFVLKQVKIPKILWYGDQRDTVQKWLVRRIKHVDLFLHTTAGKRLNEYHSLSQTPSSFFMVPCQPNLYNDSLSYKHDIFFSGSPLSTLGDNVRHDVLSALSTRKDFKWFGKEPKTVIKGVEYSSEMTASKILVSVNHFNDYLKYSSDRIIHYSAAGFTLSYNIPGFRDLFTHIPTFDSVDSMQKLLDFYLNNTDERESLKNLIINETRTKYNAVSMCKYILDLIEKKESALYPQFDYLS